MKVLPAPSTLSTAIVPPCCSTSCRALASPIPVPPIRPATFPARRKRSKIRGRSAAGTPSPWSVTARTAHAAPGAPSSRATVTTTSPPAGLYLIALASRLSSTRPRRTASHAPVSSGSAVSTRTRWRSVVACCSAATRRASATASVGRRRSSSGWPASRRVDVQQLVQLLPHLRGRRVDARQPLRQPRSVRRLGVRTARRRRSWAMPLTTVSGVLRSCAALARNSSRARIASCASR